VKARVVLTIEVDPTEWARHNRTGSAESDVRADMRAFVAEVVQESRTFQATGATVLRTN
jgi:hypothetical protein